LRAETLHGPAIPLLVAGAVLLPPEAAAALALPACLVLALRRRATAHELLLGLAASGLGTFAASTVAHAAPGTAALAGAVAAFTLAAGAVEAASGRATPPRIGAQLALASLGVAIASLWQLDPTRTPFALAPLLLLARSWRLPALERQAGTDPKTGLLNSRRFDEELELAIARARTDGRPVSVIVADLDLLREINNEHGHLVGDAVIAGVSAVIREQTRRNDLAARFGGEEFLIALPGTPPERAIRMAERLREAVASRIFAGDHSAAAARATISAGVAAFPRDGRTATSVVHAADLAMLAAKERGRNRVVDAAYAARRREPGARRVASVY
jgi:diguanylate cyclase (GGDEF)-like protein